jgi:hypothetical protein
MARVNSRRMFHLRADFRAESKQANAPCWICQQRTIDYDAPFDDWGNEDRFELDHFFPVSTHPHLQEDPTNFRASHAGCNRDRGNNAPDVDLGTLSRVWA